MILRRIVRKSSIIQDVKLSEFELEKTNLKKKQTTHEQPHSNKKYHS